jgi:hypothetical protein
MAIFRKKTTEAPTETKVWARPEMTVTFKAEIMPGRSREERTFRIKEVLANGRVRLHNFIGEHREGAFEPINFLREKARGNHHS